MCLCLQDKLDYDPLDSTKVWEEEKYPLREVGRMTLTENPKNFFTDNEQIAFAPSNIIPGNLATADSQQAQASVGCVALVPADRKYATS
jgi:catalase